MNIELRFENTSLLSPKVIIRNGDHLALFTHTRWVQLVALLVYKRMQELDGGRVSIDELKRSMAFRRLSPQNVVRFFYSSTHNQSPLIIEFIRSNIELPVSGPIRLSAGLHTITADIKPLEAYIQLVFGNLRYNSGQDSYLWKTAFESLRAFEFQSASFALSGFLSESTKQDGTPISMEILALLNLGTVEYILRGNTPFLDSMLKRASILAGSLKNGKEKVLLQAYCLERMVWTSPMVDYSSRRTIQANNRVIDLASELPVHDPDRAALLVSRHYYSIYTALRFGTRTDVAKEVAIVKDFHQQLAGEAPPKIIPYEPGSFKVASLQMSLLRRATACERVSSEEMAQYDDCLRDERISRINTLSAAEWIAVIESRSGNRGDTIEFLTDSLLNHAQLNQTAIYARVRKLRETLKTQI